MLAERDPDGSSIDPGVGAHGSARHVGADGHGDPAATRSAHSIISHDFAVEPCSDASSNAGAHADINGSVDRRSDPDTWLASGAGRERELLAGIRPPWGADHLQLHGVRARGDDHRDVAVRQSESVPNAGVLHCRRKRIVE